MSATLGIDIGGTKVICIVEENGEILSKDRRLTEFDQCPDHSLQQVINSSLTALQSAKRPVVGAGISCGGPLDPERGVLHKPANLHGWENLPLAARLSEALGISCRLENDANCAALGEALYGAGREARYMLYLTISTGIGGGIVLNRQLYAGANGNAAEFGHIVVWPGGPLCGCGKKGCLEAAASGTHIAQRYRELSESVPLTRPFATLKADPSAGSGQALAPTGERGELPPAEVTAADVVRLAQAGDAAASQVWREAIQYLGIGIGNLINAFNPELVVLGGGVTEAGDLLFEPLREEAAKTALPELYAVCKIVPAARAPYSGALGACAIARQFFGR